MGQMHRLQRTEHGRMHFCGFITLRANTTRYAIEDSQGRTSSIAMRSRLAPINDVSSFTRSPFPTRLCSSARPMAQERLFVGREANYGG
ncbi:erythromycin esterase [Anopheles sinensis]|uniref:Erythromycin esterase n=1 Tax=Anopheles sinensis TaxID=74873 RepID=A0A084W6X6_ANOSI|nr:erythromycin esterase [Anopheles sinensis]